MIKIGQRVKFPSMPFLSDGAIVEQFSDSSGLLGYSVKLDRKAPNEYAYDTDLIFVFPDELEVINDWS